MATDTPAEGTPASSEGGDDAAYMAGLNAILNGKEEPAKEEPPKAEEKAEDKPDEAETDEDEKEDGEEGDDEEKAEDADSEEDEEDESEVDKEALRKLQKEKRSFERHKAEVLAHEREVKDLERRVVTAEKEVADFIGKLRVDPFGTLLSHKLLSEEDISYAAKQLYLMSPEAAKDPRSKAEAERLRRERERDMESKRALLEVERLKAEREQERAQLAEERKLNEYVARIDEVTTVFKAKTPLLSKSMTKDPAATRRELFALASELAEANGRQFVEPGKVVLAWEKRERERLARLDLAAPTETAVPSKAKTPTAAKQQGHGQKAATGAAPPAKERPADSDVAQSEEEYRAELRRRLQQGG